MHPIHSVTGAPHGGGDNELLARASRVLAGSLNVDRLVDLLLDLLVPDLVAWAQVTISEGRGRHRAVYRGRRAPASKGTQWMPPEGGTRSVAGVTTAGRRAVLSTVLQADLDRIAAPPARDWLRPCLPAEAVVLPLAARGTVFGTLTLLDRGDGSLTAPDAVAVWGDLAERAALALDSARMYQDRRHALDVLQQGLRPPTLGSVEGLRAAAFYRPADTVAGLGGDFYDLHADGGDLTVVLGDVSGKGVEAAVLAGRARQILRTAALVDARPSAVLELLNRVLVSSADPLDERFITVVCAALRPSGDGRWSADLASAGHPPPLVLRADGPVERVRADGPLTGLMADVVYRDEAVTLLPGDTLLLFTDGVTESRNAEDEQFGTERVARLLAELPGAEPEAVVAHIARSALEWGTSAPDDVAVLALRIEPASAA